MMINGNTPQVTLLVALLVLLGRRQVSNAFLHIQHQWGRQRVRDSHLHSQSADRPDIQLLLVDHYDSFTYNLAALLTQHCANPPTVLLADDPRLLSHTYTSRYDGIVLSPGPGHPRDYPSSIQLIHNHPETPILGVCLGHQLLASAYGDAVVRAPVPVHGQIHPLEVTALDDDPLWRDIDRAAPLATRYHSLVVDLRTTSQSELIPTARTMSTGILMGLRHSRLSHFGLQFHPESVGTLELGQQLVRNYCQLVAALSSGENKQKKNHAKIHGAFLPTNVKTSSAPSYTVYIHKVPYLPPNGANYNPAQVFDRFLSDTDYAFWLDHEAARDSYKKNGLSIMGTGRRRVEYSQKHGGNGTVRVHVKDEETQVYTQTTILDYLQSQPITNTIHMLDDQFLPSEHKATRNELPFDFCGGHVGYLGYEVRHDTVPHHQSATSPLRPSDHPTAAFIWADQSYVFDHARSEWYLVGVSDNDASNEQSILQWIRSASQQLREGVKSHVKRHDKQRSIQRNYPPPSFQPNRSKQTYNDNFLECMKHIHKGDSYELCLTNQIETTAPRSLSPLDLYRTLRRRNPAPHAAFFHWGSQLAICCSSPERFVSVQTSSKHDPTSTTDDDDPSMMVVEAKPIKGTARRVLDDPTADAAAAERLRTSRKDRAENLMIVDLLRNDLHRVCDNNNVHVPHCMAIESFATVHQMVSTIRGRLQPSATAVDVLRACFPGGSMTGAPKLRSMEILDRLEEGVPRGVYAGCLGYLSCNGSMDMNIVIRTAVLTDADGDSWKVRIGAGGAITALSDGQDEYDEMLLKASAVMNAVEEWVVGDPIVDESDARDGGSILSRNNTSPCEV